MRTYEELERSLTNQSPSDEQIDRIEQIRGDAKTLALSILDLSNPSREQSLALTKLEETVMWAVKGIVLEEPPVPEDEGMNFATEASIVSAAVDPYDPERFIRQQALDFALRAGGNPVTKANEFLTFLRGES